jgi:addiction module HigA family antidote
MTKPKVKEVAKPAVVLPGGGPAALLRMWLTGTHTSAAAMAKSVGVTRQHIARLLAEDLRLTPEMAIIIGKWSGTKPLVWLASQNLRDVQRLEADPAFKARLQSVRPWQSAKVDELRDQTNDVPVPLMKKAR